MSNNVKVKKVKIKLDKERTLLFDLNALCDLEEVFGTVNNALLELSKDRMSAVRKALFIALQHEDEELTEKEVGKMINLYNYESLVPKMLEAFNLSNPEAETKEKN